MTSTARRNGSNISHVKKRFRPYVAMSAHVSAEKSPSFGVR